MILRIFTLTLEPVNPLRFSLEELRSFFNRELAAYTRIPRENESRYIHRYPALQCKSVKDTLMAIGISQGAGFLRQITEDQDTIHSGAHACIITGRDAAIRNEEFGTTGTSCTYEFQTPWLALNQQNAKKFYDLKGKPDRDAFMQKILLGHLNGLAKSLDYGAEISCEAKVRFRKERVDDANVMVFLGKFRTNLRIPDYLGIGQSVSRGFGTLCHTSQDGHDEIQNDLHGG
jgi:hypothetical protein